jgi:pilus assembly protein CpaB
MLMVAAAATLGIIAAAVANKWVANRLAGDRGTTVVVAAIAIPFGQKIESGHVTTTTWPEGSAPKGSFSKVDEVIGKIANQEIVPDEPLLAHRVVESLDGSTLAAMVDPAKRAVTVRVNDVVGVAGFLLPGNRVDVLASRKVDQHRAQTRILLHDLKVLAVDQTASPEKDKPVVVRAVTLEVEPKQAESLVNATVEGTVQLALRNPVAETIQIVEKKKVYVPRKAPVVEAKAAEPPVTFIRGSNVELSDRKL